jgi:hypothetical protein
VVDTFQAIAVTTVALLPGALYVWGFEGQVGFWGIRLVDRVLRFFGYLGLPRFDGQGWWLGQATCLRTSWSVVSNSSGVR